MPKPSSAFLLLTVLCSLVLAACGSESNSGTALKDCNYASTYDAIQATIFEAKGCTASSCHGDAMLGGLDLSADASFDALVRQPSSIDPSIERVFPGDQGLSLLYLKLESGTEGTDLGSLGQAMPIDGEPLSPDELAAMRLWIRAGAPSDSIVGGTLELLGCAGSFEPDPNKINPLPAPASDEGVQFYAGGWGLDGESEDEVCFASYYDFTDTVPPEYQVDCDEFGEGRKCFAFRRNELAQDGQSHHSIISVYTPESDPNGGDWGPWACLGGDRAGEACDPTAAADACGARSQCTTPAVTSVACVGYRHAPQDFGLGGGLGGPGGDNVIQLGGAQESTSIDVPPPGVYSVLPLKGFVSWNSHGFNLTKKASSIEQWVNLTFAPESERVFIREQIFEADNIFAMSTVTPFEKREICMTWTLPRYAQLMSLSSHMHTRGELFRIWLPPNEPCEGTIGCVPRRPPRTTRAGSTMTRSTRTMTRRTTTLLQPRQTARSRHARSTTTAPTIRSTSSGSRPSQTHRPAPSFSRTAVVLRPSACASEATSRASMQRRRFGLRRGRGLRRLPALRRCDHRR